MCSTTKALFSNLSAKPKGNFRPAVLNVKYVFDMNSIPNQYLDNGEKSEKKKWILRIEEIGLVTMG